MEALDYFTRDHLGSVREMLNSSGSIVARYSYDPYGRTTLVSGSNLATFQYTGDYAHQPSGLNLTRYRAYDPNTGRWLSRDPLRNAERSQGPNLYDYVQNDPVDNNDPTGTLTAGRLAVIGGTQVAGGGPEDILVDIIDIGILLWPDPPDPKCDVKKCKEHCYELYEEHCATYCSKLPTKYQQRRCHEEAMKALIECWSNCEGDNPRRHKPPGG